MVRSLEKIFNTEFDSFFLEEGYRSESLGEYVQTVDGIQRMVSLPPFRSGNSYRVSIGLGIRVPTVEAIWRPDNGNTPTVGVPLHLIKPERKYQAWDFMKPKELSNIAAVIRSELSCFGLPFLQEFEKVADVHSRLESDNPDDWMMCTMGNRAALLVYFAWAIEGLESANNVANELKDEFAHRHPKHRYDLDVAIEKLEAANREQT